MAAGVGGASAFTATAEGTWRTARTRSAVRMATRLVSG